MAPNLFLCLRTAFCPLYWFHRGDRSRKGHQKTEKPPVPIVYCHILHRYLFEDEMEDRCSWHCIATRDGASPEKLRFFLLDDGYTWVVGWDAQGKPIPGPYRKWHFDPMSNSMRKAESPPRSANISRRSSVVPHELV